MRRHLAFVILTVGLWVCSTSAARAEAWPCWRGPRGDGTCIEKNVPARWDPAVALWKVELPGKGHASPAISDGQVFLRGFKHLFCFGRKAN